jgi:hypothetical protein
MRIECYARSVVKNNNQIKTQENRMTAGIFFGLVVLGAGYFFVWQACKKNEQSSSNIDDE